MDENFETTTIDPQEATDDAQDIVEQHAQWQEQLNTPEHLKLEDQAADLHGYLERKRIDNTANQFSFMSYKSAEELLRMTYLALHDTGQLSTTIGGEQTNQARTKFLNSLVITLSQLGLAGGEVKQVLKDKGLL